MDRETILRHFKQTNKQTGGLGIIFCDALNT